MSMWREILFAFGGSSVLLLVVAFLVRTLLLHFLNQDFEAHKIRLQSTADAEIERLRHAFQIRSFEHQTRFGFLHQKRAQVLAEIYGHISRTYFRTASLTKHMQWVYELPRKQKLKDADDALRLFYKCLDENRIYIPGDLCQKVEEIFDVMRECTIDAAGNLDEDGNPDDVDQWGETWKRMEAEVPPLRNEIEVQFRRLLQGEDTELFPNTDVP